MTRLMSTLRVGVRAVALVVLLVGCSTSDDANSEAPWGSESLAFFEALTVEHSANDFYGVLDFYTPSAFIEKWRGDLRGGAPVAELLRWNSGDLDQEILGVYLNSRSALTLVSWASTSEWSAVVSTVEAGLIGGETVFDFSGTLDRSLRGSPDAIATYESLYTSYAAAWSSGDSEDIARMYASSAGLNDGLTGLNIEGSQAIAALGPTGVTLSQPRILAFPMNGPQSSSDRSNTARTRAGRWESLISPIKPGVPTELESCGTSRRGSLLPKTATTTSVRSPGVSPPTPKAGGRAWRYPLPATKSSPACCERRPDTR